MKLLAPSVPASPFSVMSGLVISQPLGKFHRTRRVSLNARSLDFRPSRLAAAAVPTYFMRGDKPLAFGIAGKPCVLRNLLMPLRSVGSSEFAPYTSASAGRSGIASGVTASAAPCASAARRLNICGPSRSAWPSVTHRASASVLRAAGAMVIGRFRANSGVS